MIFLYFHFFRAISRNIIVWIWFDVDVDVDIVVSGGGDTVGGGGS